MADAAERQAKALADIARSVRDMAAGVRALNDTMIEFAKIVSAKLDQIEGGEKAESEVFEVGDNVQITDKTSLNYGRTGVIARIDAVKDIESGEPGAAALVIFHSSLDNLGPDDRFYRMKDLLLIEKGPK